MAKVAIGRLGIAVKGHNVRYVHTSEALDSRARTTGTTTVGLHKDRLALIPGNATTALNSPDNYRCDAERWERINDRPI